MREATQLVSQTPCLDAVHASVPAQCSPHFCSHLQLLERAGACDPLPQPAPAAPGHDAPLARLPPRAPPVPRAAGLPATATSVLGSATEALLTVAEVTSVRTGVCGARERDRIGDRPWVTSGLLLSLRQLQ